MRRGLFILWALLLSIIAATAQIDTERVTTIGKNAIYFKDYVLAIQYFNTAIETAPQKAEPYYYRGLAKYSLDDYRGAEADSDAALQRNPFITGAYYLRAIARHTLGKDSLAMGDYEKVLQDNPDHKGALHNASVLYISLGDTVKARKTLDHLQRFYADYPEGYVIDGGLQLERGDTLAAVGLFEKAMKMAPGLSGAYISMAGIAYDQRNFAKAESYMDRAIDHNPSYAALYINRALMRYRQNNIRGAMQDYSTAVRLEPSNLLARYNRALLRSQVGALNDALEDFSYVVKMDPNNYFAIFNRGIIANELGYLDVAESDMDRIIDRYPSFVPAYTQRSEARRGQDKVQAAQQDLHYASRLLYDPVTHKSAVAQQKEQNKEEESQHQATNEVRDNRDENIRKFKLLVYNSQEKGYNELYQEEASLRGRVQDRKVVVQPEPLYTLSYYDVVDEKLRSSTNLAFTSQLGLPEEGAVLRVVRHVPPLSADLVQQHLTWANAFNPHAPSNGLKEYFHHAMDRLALKDHELVVQLLTELLDTHPDFAPALFQRATSRYLALELKLRELQEEQPRSTNFLASTSTTTPSQLLKRAEVHQSIRDLEKVLELIPRYAPALYNIGYLYAELGQFQDAIQWYTKALEVEPRMGAAYFNRGLAHYSLGEKVKGDEDLSQAGALGFYKSYSIIREMQ